MDVQRAQLPVDWRVTALAGTQHGVVTRAQLSALGLGRGAIEHRLHQGRLHSVHRGIYAVGRPQLELRGRWLAAVLACGSEAVLSHGAAAALWGLTESTPESVGVTIRSRAGRRRRDGILVHRAPALAPADVARRDGIPVTSPARTLLDLAATVPRRVLERAIDQAEQLRLFDLSALRAVMKRSPRHAGGRPLCFVLEQQRAGTGLPRSELEARFLALCDAHGLERPEINVRVDCFVVDFLWRRERLIAETDGRRSHGTRAAFERDRARDARLAVLDYRVLRFTYSQVTQAPEAVGGVMRALLGRPPL